MIREKKRDLAQKSYLTTSCVRGELFHSCISITEDNLFTFILEVAIIFSHFGVRTYTTKAWKPFVEIREI